jgi:hypothetical protein
MSLGPHLQIGGTDSQIPMPYALLNNVPFIGASRQPLRFVATAGICLSLLASFGVSSLLERPKGLVTGHWSLVTGLLLLSALELFGIPRAMTSTSIGPAYSFIRDAREPGAVMELPYELWQGKPQLYQSLHDRPLLGGYTSRHYPYPFIEAAPGASQLAAGFPDSLDGTDIITPSIQQTALPSLDYYSVRYVVLHKADLASGRFGRLVSLLKTLYPSGPVYDDADVSVFETPLGPATDAATSKLPIVGLGRGWHDIEENPIRRWTGSDPGNGDAYVWLGIRPSAAGSYILSMDTFAYGNPRHLSIVLDGKTLLKKEIGLAPESLIVNLGNLSAGDYGLVLHVDEQPTSPPGDRRLLSIGVTRLEITRQGP